MLRYQDATSHCIDSVGAVMQQDVTPTNFNPDLWIPVVLLGHFESIKSLYPRPTKLL